MKYQPRWQPSNECVDYTAQAKSPTESQEEPYTVSSLILNGSTALLCSTKFSVYDRITLPSAIWSYRPTILAFLAVTLISGDAAPHEHTHVRWEEKLPNYFGNRKSHQNGSNHEVCSNSSSILSAYSAFWRSFSPDLVANHWQHFSVYVASKNISLSLRLFSLVMWKNVPHCSFNHPIYVAHRSCIIKVLPSLFIYFVYISASRRRGYFRAYLRPALSKFSCLMLYYSPTFKLTWMINAGNYTDVYH